MLTLNSHTEAPVGMSYQARPLKRAPLHPGVVIADILDEQRISLRAAAKAIGMSPTGLDKVLKGENSVTPETATRIGVWFGNGPDLWLDMQRAYDLWHVHKRIGARLKKIKPISQ